MGNGALDEAMGLLDQAIGDNNQVEQPYRTTGQIVVNDAGDILNVYVKGILVDFDIRICRMGPYHTQPHTEDSISSADYPVFI